jgi:hypothetical protein
LAGRITKPPVDAASREAPKGDGHAVLVLPAWLRGDGYTATTCQFLTAIGYSAHGWKPGVNIGPKWRLLDGSAHRLIELSDANGAVSLLGFSMGGLFAVAVEHTKATKFYLFKVLIYSILSNQYTELLSNIYHCCKGYSITFL